MESQLTYLTTTTNKNKFNHKLFFIAAGGSTSSNRDSVSSEDSDDIEMISVDSLSSYTSLKDILRSASPPSPLDSPGKFKRIDSWREIPIKDPLLQHAAWAYLQPMSSEPETDNHRCCFWKLKDCFCGVFSRR